MAATSEPATISVNLNTAYVLTASQSSGTITLTLRTVSTGATQTGSFSNGANVIGKGPVTIGGWRDLTSENFPGTISYVNVSVPTNQRVITFSSGTSGTPATVTATQDSFLDFTSGTKTATLTVSKLGSTLGALTVPAKIISDPPFTLTAPTSSISSIISPTYTITTTTSTMITPPDIQDISYGTTWIQRGADIDGEAANDESGVSVSLSADGRVLAVGAYSNDNTAGVNAGHVRVYELSGNTWVRRGEDIDGEKRR